MWHPQEHGCVSTSCNAFEMATSQWFKKSSLAKDTGDAESATRQRQKRWHAERAGSEGTHRNDSLWDGEKEQWMEQGRYRGNWGSVATVQKGRKLRTFPCCFYLQTHDFTSAISSWVQRVLSWERSWHWLWGRRCLFNDYYHRNLRVAMLNTALNIFLILCAYLSGKRVVRWWRVL